MRSVFNQSDKGTCSRTGEYAIWTGPAATAGGRPESRACRASDEHATLLHVCRDANLPDQRIGAGTHVALQLPS